MKKAFFLILSLTALTVSAQKTEKQIPLSLEQHKFLLTLKNSSDFKTLIIPDEVTSITENGVWLQSRYFRDKISYVFTKDGEFQVHRGAYEIPNLFNVVKEKSSVYYLRMVNDKIFGYKVVNHENGKAVVEVFNSDSGKSYDHTFRAVK